MAMSPPEPPGSFRDYARRTGGGRFRDWLRDRAEPHWTRMVEHRITKDMAGDTLPPAALRRYLIHEHGFVETAVTIFAYALVKAPGIAEQSHLVETLRGLTTDQFEYFERVFGELGVSAAERDATPNPAEVLAFCDGMMRLAAHGTYEEIIAGMAAAEWMYLTWSRAAHERQPRDRDVRGVDRPSRRSRRSQARWSGSSSSSTRWARRYLRATRAGSRMRSGGRSSSRSPSTTHRTWTFPTGCPAPPRARRRKP